jgi:hypothetical protein
VSWTLVLHATPYRTPNGRIEGMVITFTDIMAAKALEPKLPETLP